MKLIKGRTYDSIFLCDIHFLVDKKIKDTQYHDLFRALKTLRQYKISFRQIILAGDIIENWYFSANRKIKKHEKRLAKLFNRMEALVSSSGQRIYLIGNHDTSSWQQNRLPLLIEHFLFNRGWQILEIYQDDQIVVAHGHQGQYGKIKWFLNIIFLRMLYLLAEIWPAIWQKIDDFHSKYLDFDKNSSPHKMLSFYQKLSYRLDQRHRVLLVGHTHKAACLDSLNVINIGDWVSSKTLVIRDRNSFIGLKYIHPRKKNKRFMKQFILTKQ